MVAVYAHKQDGEALVFGAYSQERVIRVRFVAYKVEWCWARHSLKAGIPQTAVCRRSGTTPSLSSEPTLAPSASTGRSRGDSALRSPFQSISKSYQSHLIFVLNAMILTVTISVACSLGTVSYKGRVLHGPAPWLPWRRQHPRDVIVSTSQKWGTNKISHLLKVIQKLMQNWDLHSKFFLSSFIMKCSCIY